MTGPEPIVFIILKFMIPSVFSILFRIFGLGARSRFRAVTGTAIFLTYMIIVPYLLISVMSYGEYKKAAVFVMIAADLIVFYISSDGIWETAFLHSCQGNVILAISITCNGFKHIYGFSYQFLCVLEFIVSIIIYFLAVKYLAGSLRYIADHVRVNWILMLAIPIGTFVSCTTTVAFFTTYFGSQPLRYMAVVPVQETIFRLFLYMLYMNLKITEHYLEEKNEQAILAVATRNMGQRISIMEESEKQSRRESHDRRYFNNMLLELLNTGQTEAAKDLLQKQGRNERIRTYIYCDEPLINASAAYYAGQAECEGIETKIHFEMGPDLRVDELELSFAIANLLENAVNACMKMPEGDPKYIHMQCLDKGRLILEVSNSCSGQVVLDADGDPAAGEDGHGVGTKSIRAFVEKYQGELLYKTEPGSFKVRILL
jgi:Histidine kinase-, DNA gyrase B-, and HSP90-like ATPase.